MAATETMQWLEEPISRESIEAIEPLLWMQFQKKVPTSAIRMNGPFEVATSEGTLSCADGWLCLDARGYPYPVAADEFELIYQPLAERPKVDGETTSAPWLPDGMLSQLVTATQEGLLNSETAKTAALRVLEHYGLADRIATADRG